MSRKLIISWIIASLLMFFLSYLWHGILLNDFRKISYPIEFFIPFLFLLYLILGFGLSFINSIIYDKKKPLLRGALVGIAAGFTVFLIVFVLGTSLSGAPINTMHVSVDFIWQIIEQGLGGLITAYVYNHVHQREMIFE
jgi:hypothetical protein